VTPAEDLYVSHSLDEAQRIANDVVARRYDTVLFGGGDGTLVRGVEHLARAASTLDAPLPAIGVLRLGTGNAFADAVGAGPFTANGLIADVLRARQSEASRPVPMLEALDRVTPFCGFGLDAQILEDHHVVCDAIDKSPLSRLLQGSNARYALSVALRSVPRYVMSRRARLTVRNLGAPALRMGTDGAPVGAPVKAGDVIWSGPCTLASCSTIPFFGLGMKMFPFAEVRRDRFQLRCADASALEILSNIRPLFTGTYRSQGMQDFLCDHVAMEVDQPAAFEIGGELVGRFQRVEVALGQPFRVA
jgi:diacylglycerol kinase family enzyme